MSDDDWYNPHVWTAPPVIVSDIEEPKVSRILGPDGRPLAYKPQQRPIGFYSLGNRLKER